LLLNQTERFANVEIYGYCWRDAVGGVLPGGYGPSSIAAQAVTEFFTEQRENGLVIYPQQLGAHLKRRSSIGSIIGWRTGSCATKPTCCRS
jgi:hypothetical protein